MFQSKGDLCLLVSNFKFLPPFPRGLVQAIFDGEGDQVTGRILVMRGGHEREY